MAVAFIIDESGRCLPLQPLTHPSFMQSHLLREFAAGHRLAGLHCAIKTQAVTEINHCRDERTAEHPKHLLRGLLRFRHINVGCSLSHLTTCSYPSFIVLL